MSITTENETMLGYPNDWTLGGILADLHYLLRQARKADDLERMASIEYKVAIIKHKLNLVKRYGIRDRY